MAYTAPNLTKKDIEKITEQVSEALTEMSKAGARKVEKEAGEHGKIKVYWMSGIGSDDTLRVDIRGFKRLA